MHVWCKGLYLEKSLCLIKFLVTLIVLFFTVLSCKENAKINFTIDKKGTSEVTFKSVGELLLPIDSITAPNFDHFQLLETDTGAYISILNRIHQDIQLYDLESGALRLKIPLYYTGPNSVGALSGHNSGYYIKSYDSVFVLNRNSGLVYLVNFHGDVSKSFSVIEDKALPSPIMSVEGRPVFFQDKIILMNNQSGINVYSKIDNYESIFASIYDLNTGGLDTRFLSYPNVYSEGIWGDFFHRISWAFVPKEKQIHVSYPISEFIYVYNLDGTYNSKYLATNKAFDFIESMESEDYVSTQKEAQYLFSQNRFGTIIYDSYNDLIVRDSHEGFDIEYPDYSRSEPYRSLLLIDVARKRKVGEFKLASGTRLLGFAFEGKVYIHEEIQNENFIKFNIFEIVRL